MASAVFLKLLITLGLLDLYGTHDFIADVLQEKR